MWLFLNEKPHWLLPGGIDNERKCSRAVLIQVCTEAA